VARGRVEEVLARVNLLEQAPVRAARWEERGDRVVLIRPRPEVRGLRSALEWLACQLAPPRLRLDPIGSFAWRRLDGTASVARVAEAVRERFGDASEPTEERLGQLVRLLRRDGFVVLPPWDPRPPTEATPLSGRPPPASQSSGG
jgi:hypothetical protein